MQVNLKINHSFITVQGRSLLSVLPMNVTGNMTAGGHQQLALRFIAALVLNQMSEITKTTGGQPHCSLLMPYIQKLKCE